MQLRISEGRSVRQSVHFDLWDENFDTLGWSLESPTSTTTKVEGDNLDNEVDNYVDNNDDNFNNNNNNYNNLKD